MKKTSFKKTMACGLSFALIITGMGMTGSASADAAKKATLKLNKSAITITPGKKIPLKLSKKTNVAKVGKITWTSKNIKIAKVNKKVLLLV